MLPCKRFKHDKQEDEPQSNQRCLSNPVSTQSLGDAPTDRSAINSDNVEVLTQLISVWSDTQSTRKRVLLHLQSTETIQDILLRSNVNKKFLQFHHDITEECGTEDRQHSWAVIEKKQEVVLYGPYYPNYNSGKHSEDIIIRQTEELLKSTDGGEDWMVYVFTMNSPCLSRNSTQTPCMLKLVEKAKEWWLRFRLKTNIGYNKCWGFKGTKETMFRAVNYSQIEAVDKSVNYEEYLAQKPTGEDFICKNVYMLLDTLLKRGPFPFHLSQVGDEWRSYFKGMQTIAESAQSDEKEVVKREITRMTEEVKSLLTNTCMNETEHMGRGHTLALDFIFDSRVTKGMAEQLRQALGTFWKEMVQDKYAETLRDILTEDFNKCTNLLFIKDFVSVTSSYLHIGRIHCKNEKQQK